MAEPQSDSRLVNLLGAAAIGLTDASVADIATDGALDPVAATALVALLDLARGGSERMLSQLVGLTHSGTVRLVNRLAKAELVERKPGPNGRTISVSLTRRGRGVARRIRAGRHALIAATLSGLTEHERAQLELICEKLITNLTKARLAQRAAGGQPSGGALCRMCDPTACERSAGNCPAARAAATPLQMD